MKTALSECPACSGQLEIRSYGCTSCETEIQGHFTGCLFCRMSDEDRYFCLVFLQCEGNMKDVEQIMGISYPTIKNKLVRVMKVLGLPCHEEQTDASAEGAQEEVSGSKSEQARETGKKVLDSLAGGEIDFERAIELLKSKESRQKPT
ncbi:MAG: hypothetical protein A2161_10510 [Candidatus Schekmanbacteria bacterium RBG_13_48_7]|uniref:DUF2089 domain-containing protein n=1 Tax=Candidatus Schekmanbacteria bacterium RBG_13_48_7 TaxID=1817878 RepID=A0A1F7RJ45_9BACT|nr:MAG: hypothetical protein A2161_10510 [Candidatus Schekmanbacteria bacterium RBG_13_48_7]